MQKHLAKFVFTSLLVAFTAILFYFAKLSPLKDGAIYFALLFIESLIVLEFGFKLATEYYLVSCLLAWIILQFPFCLGYILLVGTWPIVKFYLQLRIKQQTFILAVAKTICFLIYALLTLMGTLYFNQLTLNSLIQRVNSLLANLPFMSQLSWPIALALICLAAHIIDYILDNCLYYYIVHGQTRLHKALKLR